MKILIALIAMFVVACSGRISDLSRESDEAIILMRARVFTPEKEEILGTRFFFNESSLLKFGVRTDEYNYLYFKLKRGYYNLDEIVKTEHTSKVPNGTLNFIIDSVGIYYLGDITFVADFNKNAKNLADFLITLGMWIESNENNNIDISQQFAIPLYAIGVMYDEFRSDNEAKIKIENNYAKDIKYFNDKFGNKEEIKMLKVNSAMIDTAMVNTFKDNKLSNGDFYDYIKTLKPDTNGVMIDSTGRKVNQQFKIWK